MIFFWIVTSFNLFLSSSGLTSYYYNTNTSLFDRAPMYNYYETNHTGGRQLLKQDQTFLVRIDIYNIGWDSGKPMVYCSGVVINLLYVLTTAHCGAVRGFSGYDLYVFHHNHENDLRGSSNAMAAFVYDSFWSTGSPNICVLQLLEPIQMKKGVHEMVRIPIPGSPESVLKEGVQCGVYGMTKTNDYWTKEGIGVLASIMNFDSCRNMYATEGDTVNASVPESDYFCLETNSKEGGPETMSLGGPVFCGRNSFLVGIVVFSKIGNMLGRNLGFHNIYVALKVVKFQRAVYVAADYRRTSARPIVVAKNVTITQANVEYDLENEDQVEEKPLRKILISIFLGLIFILCMLCCLYLVHYLMACPCPKREEDYFEAVHDDQPLTQTIGRTKLKKLKWCGPRSQLRDIVIPFFFLLITIILTRLMWMKFSPGYVSRRKNIEKWV